MSKHSVLVQWSEEDEAFIATVPELPGLSAFGSSPEKAVEELSIAKEAYLEVLSEDGEETPAPDVLKPFSGQIRLRFPKSLHAFLSNEAKKEGVSLNTYIVTLLSERSSLSQISGKLESIIHKLDDLKEINPDVLEKLWVKADQVFGSMRQSGIATSYIKYYNLLQKLQEDAEEVEIDPENYIRYSILGISQEVTH